MGFHHPNGYALMVFWLINKSVCHPPPEMTHFWLHIWRCTNSLRTKWLMSPILTIIKSLLKNITFFFNFVFYFIHFILVKISVFYRQIIVGIKFWTRKKY
jgi:hypothetical protein